MGSHEGAQLKIRTGIDLLSDTPDNHVSTHNCLLIGMSEEICSHTLVRIADIIETLDSISL
jgi:hypothetical protein